MATEALPFHKVVGAGNDFVVLEHEVQSVQKFIARESVVSDLTQMCDRNVGVGADGVVIITTEKPGHYHWKYLNRDGGPAAMCGNAARAISNFLLLRDRVDQVYVRTDESHFVGRFFDGGGITVEFSMACSHRMMNIAEEPGTLVQAGVPHFIPDRRLNWEELLPLKAQMPRLRFAPELGPAGANITWLSRAPEMKAITFERGVEDYTLACGTGAIAAAWLMAQPYPLEEGPIEITMPGGRLTVAFHKSNLVRLTGEARWVYSGEYFQE